MINEVKRKKFMNGNYWGTVSLLLFLMFFSMPCRSQNVSVKTNVLGDATTSVNIGAEVKLAAKVSLEAVSSMNFWEFKNAKKLKHLLLQPAVRYWFCEFRNGWFVGGHAHWGHFNVAGIKFPFGLFPSLRKSRYQGDLWGGGVSAGYSWMLGRHFDIESELGLGYARISYSEYPCRHCSKMSNRGKYNYWGPTKIAIRLVYSF